MSSIASGPNSSRRASMGAAQSGPSTNLVRSREVVLGQLEEVHKQLCKQVRQGLAKML